MSYSLTGNSIRRMVNDAANIIGTATNDSNLQNSILRGGEILSNISDQDISLKNLNVNTNVSDAFDDLINVPNRITDDILKNKITSIDSQGLFDIGKPCSFPTMIDPQGRVNRLLQSRMNIVDILPCVWTYTMLKDQFKSVKSGDITGLHPYVDFNEAISEFKSTCSVYGLRAYDGIRIYTTDDTTCTDSISNMYTDNFFQGAVNKMSDAGRAFTQFLRSVKSNAPTQLSDAITGKVQEAGVSQKIENVLSDQLGGPNGLDQSTIAGLTGTIGSIGEVALRTFVEGRRISLPQIWSSSTYNPSLSCVVKLVSPYGDPKAVKEFIIKPLIYLLILTSPKTIDGISYGQPHTLSVAAYGMGQAPLAGVEDITLRRGGADTSFNLFRQPLTIDVSIRFRFLNDGFGVLTAGASPNDEANCFKHSHLDNPNVGGGYGISKSMATMPTLGKVVESLRPVYSTSFKESIGSDVQNIRTIGSIEQSHFRSVTQKSKESTDSIFGTIDDIMAIGENFGLDQQISSITRQATNILTDMNNDIQQDRQTAETMIDTFDWTNPDTNEPWEDNGSQWINPDTGEPF